MMNAVAQSDVPGGSGTLAQENSEAMESPDRHSEGTRKRENISDTVEAKKKRKKNEGTVSNKKEEEGPGHGPEDDGLACAVCCETMSQSRKRSNTAILCPLCKYEACLTCVERYILNMREGQPQCMNPECQAEWHTSFLGMYFKKAWINGPYFEERSRFALKMERAKIPGDEESLLNYKHCRELETEIANLNEETKELKRQLDEKKMIVSFRKNMVSEYKHSQYLVNLRDVEPETAGSHLGQLPCQDEGCKGFLHIQTHVCNICDKITCKNCHVLLGKESDEVTENHVCKEDDIKTAKLLKVNTKPCPLCKMGVYKIEGCSQMFCTSCKTAFSWNTGKIVTSNIHNPHYFEWRREQAEDGVIPRQPGDQPGRPDIQNQRDTYKQFNVPHMSKAELWKRLGCLDQGDTLALRAGLDTHGGKRARIESRLKHSCVDNMEVALKFVRTLMAEIVSADREANQDATRLSRLHYATNNISERAFKNRLIKADKRQSKIKEIKAILLEGARRIAAQLGKLTASTTQMQAAWEEVRNQTKQLDQKLAAVKSCYGGSIPYDADFSHVLRSSMFAKRLERDDGYPSLDQDVFLEDDMAHFESGYF